MSMDPLTNGAHHVGLTVPDVVETASFFVEVLGFTKIGERPDYPAIFIRDPTVVLTLWQTEPGGAHVEFDRKRNVGLHHLALRVDDEAGLAKANERIESRTGTIIEFGPELLGDGPTRHMMCLIPGGIRLELIAPVTRGIS